MDQHCAKCARSVEQVSPILKLCWLCLEFQVIEDKVAISETNQTLENLLGIYETVAGREVRLWKYVATLLPSEEYSALVDTLFANPIPPEELQ